MAKLNGPLRFMGVVITIPPLKSILLALEIGLGVGVFFLIVAAVTGMSYAVAFWTGAIMGFGGAAVRLFGFSVVDNPRPALLIIFLLALIVAFYGVFGAHAYLLPRH